MLTLDDISDALARTAPSYDIRAAYLFGSYARGDASDLSDVDIRLECGPDVGYGDLLRLQHELEGLLCADVEIITNPPDRMRPAFRRRIQQDEMMVYEAA